MAYTIAIRDTVAPRDVNVSIHELGANFNTSNYIRVIWSADPIATQGQSTPPANILCTVNAPASGNARRVDSGFTLGSQESMAIANGKIYGTAQAANGMYYKSGEDVMSNKLEVLDFRTNTSNDPQKLNVEFKIDGFENPVLTTYYTSIVLTKPSGQGVCIADVTSTVSDTGNPNSTVQNPFVAIKCIPVADIGQTYSFWAYVPNIQDPYHVADVIIPAPTK